MKNMSFFLTTESARARTKTVTRRNGWAGLKPGDRVQQVVKGQGLKQGEKIQKIHVIQIINNRPETLNLLIQMPEYGRREMVREGFPEMDPANFVKMYCDHNKTTPSSLVNRISFRYLISSREEDTLKVPASVSLCPSCKTPLTISPDGWYMDNDGTMICDSYSSWCQSEPDIDDHKKYQDFMDSHNQEFSMSYVYHPPVTAEIDYWLINTFRWEIGE
jgi:hypothetical protein